MALSAFLVGRCTTVTTSLHSGRNFCCTHRSQKSVSTFPLLRKFSTKHHTGSSYRVSYDRALRPPENGSRIKRFLFEDTPTKDAQTTADSSPWRKRIPPLLTPKRKHRPPRIDLDPRKKLTRGDIETMTSSIQIITTATADTPGTTIMLQTQKQHYIFGTHAEGTQRAIMQMGQRLTKVQNFFMTGTMDWKNAGGLIGLTLTLADSATSAYQMAMGVYNKRSTKNPKKGDAPERPQMNVYGPPNLRHALATCRRYIFRRGIPIVATEYKDVPLQRDEDGNIIPTWQDPNIRVWALPIRPPPQKPDAWAEEEIAKECSRYEQYANSFEEYQAPENETAEARDVRYDRIRAAVLNMMFNSSWTMDTLVERNIWEVEMPSAMFVRNPTTNRIEPYRGPKPGDSEPVPDIKVLTRTPWPGAIVVGLPPTAPAPESLSYIVHSQPARGVFDPKRAKELGLTPGPDFGKLGRGESVQNSKGETITPEMVISPDRPGNGFAILDIPSIEYLQALTQREEFSSDSLTNGIKIFYWILGPGISGHPLLKEFVEKFPSAEHMFSSVDDCPNRISLDSVAAQTTRLSHIDPARYRIPQHDTQTLPQRSLYGLRSTGRSQVLQDISKNVFSADRGIKHLLMPNFRRATQDEVVHDIDLTKVKDEMDPEVLKLAEAAQHAVVQDQEAMLKWRELVARPDTEVITLGTGSALPSKYRNVSATLVRVPGIGNYLFDCGEGTLGQLQRVFNPEEMVDVLKNLRMIWISHLHADHHLGTAGVIREWYKIKHNSVPRKDVPNALLTLTSDIYGLSVVSHEGMLKWLREYASVEDYGFSRVLPFEITAVRPSQDSGSQLSLVAHSSTRREDERIVLDPKNYETVFGLADIQACKVRHCNGAMAVSLTFPRAATDPASLNPLKVSYSGDCRPAQTFTRIGKNTTVLIHEATFDDELQGDAIAKKHSTTSEALGIGAQMNARAVVLTHFSQRYQKIPILQTVQDGETDDLIAPEAMEDIQQDDAEDDGPMDAAATSALPSDSARPPPALARGQSSTDHEQVIKIKAKDMKVAIAFDYMRCKIGEIAQVEKFNDALNRLLSTEEEAEVETSGEVTGQVINQNGKKTSGDEGGGGKKKKSKRNN